MLMVTEYYLNKESVFTLFFVVVSFQLVSGELTSSQEALPHLAVTVLFRM